VGQGHQPGLDHPRGPEARRRWRAGDRLPRDQGRDHRLRANYLSRSLGLPPAQDTIDGLPTGDPSVSSADLRRTLAGGVAFHNADLDRDERLAIEAHFRSPDHPLQVIVATATLAMGVNTPASTVLIVGLRRPLDQPYTVAEYKNMVGRAGRLRFTERGRSMIVAPDFRQEHEAWNEYVTAQPEDLQSRFLEADPQGLILRVLATSGQVARQAENDRS
jgi:helicase